MWDVIKTAGNDWLRHHDARLGAALAYYSVFSLGPLLLIVVSIAGVFFGADAVRDALTGQFRSLLGPVGSQAVEAMLKGASSPASGKIAGAVGVILLLVAALGVVVQLKDALNTIWETKQPESAGVWWYLRTYLISFAGILGLGFLLAMSLVVSTGLSALSTWLGGGQSLAWELLNFAVSLAVLSALFAMLFKWFPDAQVGWREGASSPASGKTAGSSIAYAPSVRIAVCVATRRDLHSQPRSAARLECEATLRWRRPRTTVLLRRFTEAGLVPAWTAL